MNKQIIKLSIFLLTTYLFTLPQSAHAVIPPDFIFNIGTQIVQFFSIIALSFAAIFGTSFQFFKTKYYAMKYRKIILFGTIFSIIATSLGASYFYAISKQKAEYQKWLEESKKYNIAQNDLLNSDNNESKNIDKNDQLNIGGESNQNIDTSSNKFVSKIKTTDNIAKFIHDYYENIANGNLERAYEMSKKAVDYNTFRSWYLATTKITLDKLVRIDDQKSSIELTLFEGNEFIRYGVLMTLNLRNETPTNVEKSEVKILAQGVIENNNVSLNENEISEEYNFFNMNESKNIVITNQEFKTKTESGKNDFIVLDARENIEYENGYFPKSWHIRFADLKAGQWIELPKDKFVYVMCWSGIRGKEVAEFLRTKKIVTAYLENGANGWVEYGGTWMGSIKFGEKYTDPKYRRVFTTDEVKNKVTEGVILVDTREPYKFGQSHIPGSINIPIMYTPTINLENVFNQVPTNSKIITVCDGYVNCFDAKITGVELERRDHQFLGRYSKPWEYGN